MMRLTETEKQQLLASTKSSVGQGAATKPMALNEGLTLSFSAYLQQVQQFAPLLSRPKPIAFEGHSWKL